MAAKSSKSRSTRKFINTKRKPQSEPAASAFDLRKQIIEKAHEHGIVDMYFERATNELDPLTEAKWMDNPYLDKVFALLTKYTLTAGDPVKSKVKSQAQLRREEKLRVDQAYVDEINDAAQAEEDAVKRADSEKVSARRIRQDQSDLHDSIYSAQLQLADGEICIDTHNELVSAARLAFEQKRIDALNTNENQGVITDQDQFTIKVERGGAK